MNSVQSAVNRMLKKVLNHLVPVVTTLLSLSLCLAQQIPKTELTTLDGVPLVIPNSSSPRPLLLLLTFSHKGADDVASWNKQFKVPYVSDSRIAYYELADFQGVPSLVMKMILHGMRRSVKEPERSHLAPLYTNEETWKALVKYDDPDITYVLLADATGHVIWRTRGPASEPKATELEGAIQKLLSH
jgi:hypothetical protein